MYFCSLKRRFSTRPDGHCIHASGEWGERERGIQSRFYAVTPERTERPLRYDKSANRARRRSQS